MAGIVKDNLLYALLFKLNQYSVASGQLGDALTAGVTSHAYLMRYPRVANVATDAPTVREARGGGKRVVQVANNTSLMQPFDLEVADFDRDLIAKLRNTAVDNQVASDIIMYSENPNSEDADTWGLALIYYEQPSADSTDLTRFGSMWIPKCTITPRHNALTQEDFSYLTLTVKPDLTQKAVFGADFNAGSPSLDLNVTEGLDRYFASHSDPLALTSYRGDGTATSVVVAYTPTSTATNTNKFAFVHNGSSATLRAITAVSANTITLGTTAISTAETVNIIYQVPLSTILA